jgi:AAA+ superfamily predicted ATPase
VASAYLNAVIDPDGYLGKTFSAEAMSEHVKRPLYVVGAGDLGTTAADLDRSLERVFDAATAWQAIVLIDEVGAHVPLGYG